MGTGLLLEGFFSWHKILKRGKEAGRRKDKPEDKTTNENLTASQAMTDGRGLSVWRVGGRSTSFCSLLEATNEKMAEENSH